MSVAERIASFCVPPAAIVVHVQLYTGVTSTGTTVASRLSIVYTCHWPDANIYIYTRTRTRTQCIAAGDTKSPGWSVRNPPHFRRPPRKNDAFSGNLKKNVSLAILCEITPQILSSYNTTRSQKHTPEIGKRSSPCAYTCTCGICMCIK